MKVICGGHKICKKTICPHKIEHEIDNQLKSCSMICENDDRGFCEYFCCESKYLRYEKLNKLIEKI